MRYAQLVMGPAGSGKSTYCSALQNHAQVLNRVIDVVNLDPAADHFDYEPAIDIRQLIHVDDAMEDEELKFGPNGALIFCIEYLLENMEWLEEQLGNGDDDYYVFDCPGQIELYTHMNVMRILIDTLKHWNFHVCVVFLLDCQFMVEGPKFISGTLAALSVMVNLEAPHVNLVSKIDLLSKSSRKQLDRYLNPDVRELLELDSSRKFSAKYKRLTESIAHLIDDYSLVNFYPLNINDEENLTSILVTIDNAIQYGEDADVKVRDFTEEDEEQDC